MTFRKKESADAPGVHLKQGLADPQRIRTPTRVSHTVRTRDGGQKRLKCGRKQAILLMCTECLGWEHHPKDCPCTLCPLYPFRGITLASQRGDGKGED